MYMTNQRGCGVPASRWPQSLDRQWPIAGQLFYSSPRFSLLSRLRSRDVSTLDELQSLSELYLPDIDLPPGLEEAIAKLPSGVSSLAQLKQQLFKEMQSARHIVTPTGPSSSWCT